MLSPSCIQYSVWTTPAIRFVSALANGCRAVSLTRYEARPICARAPKVVSSWRTVGRAELESETYRQVQVGPDDRKNLLWWDRRFSSGMSRLIKAVTNLAGRPVGRCSHARVPRRPDGVLGCDARERAEDERQADCERASGGGGKGQSRFIHAPKPASSTHPR
jgi:hypothetical protein